MSAPALSFRARLAAAGAGLGALLGASFVQSLVTVPVALWAMTPPWRASRLLAALAVCGVAARLSIAAGRWARERSAARLAGGRPLITIGTKSVLVGAHQFLLHPILLAIGWWQEYGWGRVEIGFTTGLAACEDCIGAHPAEYPIYASLRDPRLWLAFVIHDLGYFGKPNMDGAEGETHPEFGARVMRRLFGDAWGDLVLLHSRYYAKRLGRPVSPLCHADKRVIVLEPSWLYLPRVWASGELAEFLAVARTRGETTTGPSDPLSAEERAAFASGNPWRWHRALKSYMRRWIAEHRGGKADQWTRLRHGGQPA